jgi:hypothetical protein
MQAGAHRLRNAFVASFLCGSRTKANVKWVHSLRLYSLGPATLQKSLMLLSVIARTTPGAAPCGVKGAGFVRPETRRAGKHVKQTKARHGSKCRTR